MMEFKPHRIDFAKEFAKMKNVPEILDNGYDKTPNPYNEEDAIEFITKEIENNPGSTKRIFKPKDLVKAKTNSETFKNIPPEKR